MTNYFCILLLSGVLTHSTEMENFYLFLISGKQIYHNSFRLPRLSMRLLFIHVICVRFIPFYRSGNIKTRRLNQIVYCVIGIQHDPVRWCGLHLHFCDIPYWISQN